MACALRDPSALARVATCITRLGGQALALSRAAILSATLSAGIDALVFDLEPGDLSARDFVRTVHAARPDWPVWLYYGLRILIIERLAEVASLPRVWATPQLAHPAREAEIRVHVQSLVTSVPRFRLLRVLDPLLRTRPGEVRQFLETTFESAEQGGWSGTAATDTLRGIMDTASTAPPMLTQWPDYTIRLRPGAPAPVCQVELRRDLHGFTLYGNLAWRNALGLHSGIVFARDMFDRDSLLYAQ